MHGGARGWGPEKGSVGRRKKKKRRKIVLGEIVARDFVDVVWVDPAKLLLLAVKVDRDEILVLGGRLALCDDVGCARAGRSGGRRAGG